MHENTAHSAVRRMMRQDVEVVASLHVRAFPKFFLSFLGQRFLQEFYGSFISDSQGVAFVAEETGSRRILGVIVGPVIPDGYFRRLLVRRWFAFCIASCSAVVRNPRTIPRLWRALFYRGEAPAGRSRALLSSVAVAPEAQKRGIGLLLVKAWVEDVRKRGAAGCYLTTDAENNEAVCRFYEQFGWKNEATFETPEGRKMNRYVLAFDTENCTQK